MTSEYHDWQVMEYSWELKPLPGEIAEIGEITKSRNRGHQVESEPSLP